MHLFNEKHKDFYINYGPEDEANYTIYQKFPDAREKKALKNRD